MRPNTPLPTQRRARIANAKADQWTNPELVWWTKIAQSDHAMAMDAGRSPSAEEKAYVAAVPSKKNLSNYVRR